MKTDDLMEKIKKIKLLFEQKLTIDQTLKTCIDSMPERGDLKISELISLIPEDNRPRFEPSSLQELFPERTNLTAIITPQWKEYLMIGVGGEVKIDQEEETVTVVLSMLWVNDDFLLDLIRNETTESGARRKITKLIDAMESDAIKMGAKTIMCCESYLSIGTRREQEFNWQRERRFSPMLKTSSSEEFEV